MKSCNTPHLKKLSVLLTVLMLLSAYLPTEAKPRYASLRSGNYVRLGSYMGKPVIWRCAGIDENGLLLVCTDILCFKTYSSDSTRWDKSYLRTWLNSDQKAVSWGINAPDEEHVDGNAYSSEAGFLAGFSPEELSVIKTVRLKSALNAADSIYADEGTRPHAYNSSGQFIKSIQNYTTAYGIYTQDRVFCLNISQMETIMANYPSEFISSPTADALEQSGNIKNLDGRSNSYYWLRDSLGNLEFDRAVRCVYPDGRIFFADIDDSSIGVRPALYVDEKIPVISGNGYKDSPYAVSEDILTSPLPKGSLSSNRFRPAANGEFATIFSGEYVYMGEYNGEDILWRCVIVDENGPMLMSEKILCFKAFDSAGNHSDPIRDHSGSSNWEQSNIRAWLNSDAGEGQVVWPCGNPPVSENCEDANGYSTEKGFLTSFSPEEREFIKLTPLRTVIHPRDKTDSTLGEAPLELQRNVKNLGNYAQAYSNISYDLVFLLSISEACQIKSSFGSLLTAAPTAEAINNNEAAIEGLSSDRTTDYWLRDADASAAQNVRSITPDGWVHSYRACKSANGVRPALYLDMNKVSFIGGNGSLKDPYRIQGHSFGQWEQSQPPTCTLQGQRRRTCEICGEVQEEAIPVTGHSFDSGKKIGGNFLTGKKLRFTCQSCGMYYTKSETGLWPLALGSVALFALIFFFKRED